MKIVAFNGSPRKDGNTTMLLRRILAPLEAEGIETELIQLSAKTIHGCIACQKCFENQDKRCAVKDDAANEYIEKMLGAEGIVLGSPVYFQGSTPEMKALIDRTGFVGLANGRMYRNKVGATAAVMRRSGATRTIETMNHLFLSNEIFIAGRVLGIGRDKGDVEKDAEGMEMAAALGQRMAWAMKRLHG